MKLVPLAFASFPVEKAGSATAHGSAVQDSWASRDCQLKHSLLGISDHTVVGRFGEGVRKKKKLGRSFIFSTEVLQ